MPIVELTVQPYGCCRRGQLHQGLNTDRGFPPDDRSVVAEPATSDSRKKRDWIVRWDDYSLPCVRQLVGQQVGAKEKFVGGQRARCASKKIGAGSADSEQRRERFGTASHCGRRIDESCWARVSMVSKWSNWMSVGPKEHPRRPSSARMMCTIAIESSCSLSGVVLVRCVPGSSSGLTTSITNA